MTVWNELKAYLNGDEFKEQIAGAYRRYEVLSEGALRGLIVRLIQERLPQIEGAEEHQYRVTAEDFLPAHRIKPDILIWRGKSPRIWLELKDTRVFVRSSAEADWNKLQKYCKLYPSIKAGFLIYVARTGDAALTIKRTHRTLRLWPVSIKLHDYLKDEFARWNKEYKARAHFKPKKKATSKAMVRYR